MSLSQLPTMPSGFKTTASASLRQRRWQPATRARPRRSPAGAATLVHLHHGSRRAAGGVDPVERRHVTIGGGTAPVMLTAGERQRYSAGGGPTGLWHGGETLTATAPGDVAPGFRRC